MRTVKLVSATQAMLPGGEKLIFPCQVNYYYIRTEEQAREAIEELLPVMSDPKSIVGVDVETDGFDPFVNRLLLIQFGLTGNTQYIFDARALDCHILKPLFESSCWKLGHNIKFDAKFIKHKFQVEFNRYFDTFLAEKVLRSGEFAGKERCSLSDLTKKYFGREMVLDTQSVTQRTGLEEKVEKVKRYMQMSFTKVKAEDPLNEAQLAYAAHDVAADIIIALAREQMRRLKIPFPSMLYDPSIDQIVDAETVTAYRKQFPRELSLWPVALLEFQFLEVVVDMELKGFLFDTALHSQFIDLMKKDYAAYRMDFLKKLGKKTPQRTLFGTASVNPDSIPQTREALKSLNLDLPDTRAENLELKLRELKEGSYEYDLIKTLLDYRATAKLIQAFGEDLSGSVHPATGRIHSEVTQIVNTGRMSMKRPNCFSDDTEILTDSGWKLFQDLSETDKVAQYDTSGEAISFVKPLSRIRQRFQGELIHIKSDKQIDLLVTPDHRCLLKNRKTGAYKVFQAKDYPEDWLQIMGDVTYRSYSMTTNHIKEKIPYDGYVYCVEVPAGYIVVRRNGHALITGNCQQIPGNIEWRKTGDAEADANMGQRPTIRDCFVPAKGYKFVIFDYSAQELRVASSNALDQVMIQAFVQSKDLHSYSASLIYGKPYDYIDKERKKNPEVKTMRDHAKTLNFASLYGSGPGTIGKKLNISKDEAKQLLDSFWLAYPQIAASMRRYADLAVRYGYSNTVLGRKRSYADILKKIRYVKLETSTDRIQKRVEELKMDWVLKDGPITQENIDFAKKAIIKRFKGEIGRQSGNQTIQGTSADTTKKAAVDIRREFRARKLDARIVALVHDEIITEVREDQAEEVYKIQKEKMEKALSFFCPAVPSKAEGVIALKWKK